MQGTQEMRVWFLGREDPLEEEMATHSSIDAWKIPRTEEPGGLQNTKYSLLWGCEKSDTTKHTHTLTQTHTEGLRNFLRWYIGEGCSWDSDTGLLALRSGTTALQDAPASPRVHHCSASTQEDGVAVADLGKTSWDSWPTGWWGWFQGLWSIWRCRVSAEGNFVWLKVIQGHPRSLHHEQSSPAMGVTERCHSVGSKVFLLTQDYSPSHQQVPTLAKGNSKCFHWKATE